MGEAGDLAYNALPLNAFDFQPTPAVIVADTLMVVMINRAYQKLFHQPNSPLARHVQELPLQWQDGTEEEFLAILTQPVNPQLADPTDDSDEDAPARTTKLQVETRQKTTLAGLTSTMILTDFYSHGKAFRMLSFEHIEEQSLRHTARSRSGSAHSIDTLIDHRLSSVESKSRGSASLSSIETQAQLSSRFAQLRDAFFFNSGNGRGFVFSADETFCYPSYNGNREVVPIAIDNVEMFFSDWDVWDWHFEKSLPLSEYPSMWLNRRKEKFRKRRYGLRENGKKIVLDASGDPLFHHTSGEYLGGVVWLTNLGEYEAVKAADLKAELADIRTICDRLPHLIWTLDANGDADYFSQNWYDFTGLTEAESLGKGFTTAIDPDDMVGIWAKLAEASTNRSECLAEAKYRRSDGQWIWMFVRAKPTMDSKGNILKWFGTSTEVHSLVVERLQAERKKSQMMEMLSLQDIGLFNVRFDGQLDVLEGRIGWLNGRSTLSSYRVLDETRGDGIPILKSQLRKVIEKQYDSVVFEGKIEGRWYKFRLASDADAVLGCSVDVTEQRERARLEADNAMLVNEAAFEVEKSRMKTAFLAHMSHEIRTPIAGIIGTADMLAETNVTNDQKEAIEDIQVSANNLLTIVNDILDLSKIEAGQLQFEKRSFDAHELVLQVKRLFIRLANSKKLQLLYQSQGPKPLTMVGDSGRVVQIVTNLVSNAIKFTSQGFVKISVDTADDGVRISVQDTGDGISPETMATLFQPFSQGDASTARRYGGTGLGLVISKNLAERMGGSLTLESTPSQGTQAFLTLPRGSDHASSERTSRNGSPAEKMLIPGPNPAGEHSDDELSPSQYKVLVVEDNAINRKIALNLVRKFGYRAEAVANGQEALDYLLNHEAPSAILMDCQMPLMDGYEATRKLRTDTKYQATRSVPVIALTASAIQGDREKCHAAGMDDYISKPITKPLLESALKKWITAQSTMKL